MPIYKESGLAISLADDNYFRFCECITYRKLSGSYLREIDFGWWDAEESYLYLMELTDFSSLTPDEQLADNFLNEVILRTVDCLLMLSAIWSRSRKGQNLQADITQTCISFPSELCKIKIVVVIKIESRHSRTWLSPLLTLLRARIKSKASLLDIDFKNDILLLNHEVAKRLGLPIDYENEIERIDRNV